MLPGEEEPMSETRRWLRPLACAMILVAALGCENLEPTDAEREDIETALTGYLHALADAYSKRDVSLLDGHATGAEKAAVQELLNTLAGGGDRLEATLLRFEIESLQVFRDVNATVRLMEVWDVARIDARSGFEKGRNPSSVQNSLIQMRLVDGQWLVTARQVLGTETGTKWEVTTPTAEVGGAEE
jgi:hypothetical protein